MGAELLATVEVEPSVPATAAVIWLHGLGADGHDFEPIVPYLGVDESIGLRFVFPHAPSRPVTINAGMVMPAWYDIRQLSLKRDVDEQGVLDSTAQIRQLIAREQERGVPSERIVLAGFSQGGAIALRLGLLYEHELAGVVALSTYLVCDDGLADRQSDANRSMPIFMGHGEQDPMVPLAAGEMARDRLRELGHEPIWKTYPMGHEVHPAEIRDIGLTLNAWLG